MLKYVNEKYVSDMRIFSRRYPNLMLHALKRMPPSLPRLFLSKAAPGVNVGDRLRTHFKREDDTKISTLQPLLLASKNQLERNPCASSFTTGFVPSTPLYDFIQKEVDGESGVVKTARK